jgi:hypothetical protein
MNYTFISLLSISTIILSHSPSFAMTGDQDTSSRPNNNPTSAIAKYSMTDKEYKAKTYRKKRAKNHARSDVTEIIERSVPVIIPETSSSSLRKLTSTASEREHTEQDLTSRMLRRSYSTTFHHHPVPSITIREYVLGELDKIQSLIDETGEDESQPNEV